MQVGLDAVDVEVVEAKGRRVGSERKDGEQQPQLVEHVWFGLVAGGGGGGGGSNGRGGGGQEMGVADAREVSMGPFTTGLTRFAGSGASGY